jgi:hypothetical protein
MFMIGSQNSMRKDTSSFGAMFAPVGRDETATARLVTKLSNPLLAEHGMFRNLEKCGMRFDALPF